MYRSYFFVAAVVLITSAAAAVDTVTLQNGLTVTPLPSEYPNESYLYYGGQDAQINPATPSANYGRLLQQGFVAGRTARC